MNRKVVPIEKTIIFMLIMTLWTGPGRLQAADRVLEPAWVHSVARAVMQAAAMGGQIILPEDTTRLAALQRRDGRVLWRFETGFAAIEGLQPLSNDRLAVAAGELALLNALDGIRILSHPLGCAPDGLCQFQWRRFTGEQAVLAGFGEQPTRLNLANLISGQRSWPSWADVGPLGLIAVDEQSLYLTSAGGAEILRIDRKHGQIAWRRVLPLREGVAGDRPQRLWRDGAAVRVLRGVGEDHGPFRIDSFSPADGSSVSVVTQLSLQAGGVPQVLTTGDLVLLERPEPNHPWWLSVRHPDDGSLLWQTIPERSADPLRCFVNGNEIVIVYRRPDGAVSLQVFEGVTGRTTAYGLIKDAAALPDQVLLFGDDALVSFRGQVVWMAGTSLDGLGDRMQKALAEGRLADADLLTMQARDLADQLAVAREAYTKRIRFEFLKARSYVRTGRWPEAFGTADRVLRQAPAGVLGALVPTMQEFNNFLSDHVPADARLEPQPFTVLNAVAKAIGARLLEGSGRLMEISETDRAILQAAVFQTLSVLWRSGQTETADWLFRTLSGTRLGLDVKTMPLLCRRLLASLVEGRTVLARNYLNDAEYGAAAREIQAVVDFPYIEQILPPDSKALRAVTGLTLASDRQRPNLVRRAVDMVERAVQQAQHQTIDKRAECQQECDRKRVSCPGPCASLPRCDAALASCAQRCQSLGRPEWTPAFQPPETAEDVLPPCY